MITKEKEQRLLCCSITIQVLCILYHTTTTTTTTTVPLLHNFFSQTRRGQPSTSILSTLDQPITDLNVRAVVTKVAFKPSPVKLCPRQGVTLASGIFYFIIMARYLGTPALFTGVTIVWYM
jgi:hypothetical protein